MIQFSCKCGRAFSVDVEQAGGTVQCPACGLLNDVPMLGDLASLSDDGTFNVGADPVRRDPNRLAELSRVYGQRRSDLADEDLDLRTTEEDLRHVGDDADAAAYDLAPDVAPPPPPRATPKYDPETGELIRPLELKPDEAHDAPQAIPVATAVIGYARGKIGPTAPGPSQVPAQLLRPVNLFVMLCVFVAHILLTVGLVTVLGGIIFVVFGPLALMLLILAHYGGVVDEIGPQDRDELPRPLRQLGWHEDLWGPFVQVAGALLLCFGPSIVLLIKLPAPLGPFLAALMAAGGLAAFPAVMLTTTTSGTTWNLRPDRVAAVAARCGGLYAVLVAEAAGIFATYLPGAVVTIWSLLASLGFANGPNVGLLGRWWFDLALLAIGIFLAHLFCWHLGLAYRAHVHQFPWLLHEVTGTKGETLAAAEALRASRRHERQLRMDALKEGRVRLPRI